MFERPPAWEFGRLGWIFYGVVCYAIVQVGWAFAAYAIAGSFGYDLALFDFSDPARDSGVLILPHLLLYAGPPLLFPILYFARGWLATQFGIFRPGRVPRDATGPKCELCGGQGKPGRKRSAGFLQPRVYLCDQCLLSAARDRKGCLVIFLIFGAVAAFAFGAMSFVPYDTEMPRTGFVITDPILEGLGRSWLAFLLGGLVCLVGLFALYHSVRILIRRMSDDEIARQGRDHARYVVAARRKQERNR